VEFAGTADAEPFKESDNPVAVNPLIDALTEKLGGGAPEVPPPPPPPQDVRSAVEKIAPMSWPRRLREPLRGAFALSLIIPSSP
jgi:hypothetical protein